MTQQTRIYLLQTLLLCLLFKSIVCYSNEYFNTRQIPSPNFDTYMNINYDVVENRRNFEYHPYQPHYASPQLHQLQYQRRSDETYREQRSEDSQNIEYKIQQRSVTQAPILPLPYQNRTELTRKNSPIRPEIKFPETPLPAKIAFKGCEEFEGETLCKKTRGYPNLSKIDSRGLAEHSIFFTEDVEPPPNINQRFGADPDEIDLCESVEEYIFPEGGETADSRWLFIVQNQGTLRQRVRIEKCIGTNRTCENIEENLPNNLRSVCKQSYVYRALVAVDNNTYVKEQFKIPSCCKCILKKTVNF